jgi:membrane protein implicated in regulation of membrane protease activity
MTLADWAALTLTVLSIVVLVAGGIRFLVKNYLSELKPDGNGGHNLEGRIARVENRTEKMESKLDHMYEILIDFVASQNSKKSKTKTKD